MMAPDRRLKSVLTSLAVLVVVCLLAGCDDLELFDIEQTVSFTGEETWEADVSIVIPADVVTDPEILADVRSEIERRLTGEGIQDLQARGVTVDWGANTTDAGDTVYDVHLEGDQFGTLKEAVFDQYTDIRMSIVEGRKEISFSQYSSASPIPFGIRNYSLTLVGGEIVSGNGVRVDKGTMRWTNPGGSVEARLTPLSRFSLMGTLLPVACGVGFVILVGAGLLGGLAYVRRPERAV